MDAALDLPPQDRRSFLERECAADAELRREAQQFLDACEQAERSQRFLADSAGAVVASLAEDLAARSAAAEAAVPAAFNAALAGQYTIERELGRGGMATVFLAKDERHRRQVAIKVLRPDLAYSLGSERFLLEIEIAARLRHPNIVPLYDSGEVEGLLYYVMPFVPGQSLRARLERERQLPLAVALSIARDLAQALDYAHAEGVVHRDIKPANILLDGSGALIADFGIARAIAAAGNEGITGSGVAVGTALYMSPEQGAGETSIDGRSDVYALACVVFEMLAGEPPFTGPTPQAILAKHMQAPVPELRVVRATISGRMQHVVATALAKVPADRFGSAGEFVRALDASASSALVSRRRWRLAVGGTVVLAAVVALLLRAGLGRTVVGAGARDSGLLEPPRIAVLYFDNATSDTTVQHVADGLTEDLIHELSGVNAFRVISRNGVRPYRGRSVSFDSMVRALGVNTVVDGTIQRAGDRLRVMVQLIDARSGTYLDSVSLERPMTDLIVLERQVAQEVAAALRRQMGREVRLRGALTGTRSRGARELLLKAQRDRGDAHAMAEHPHPEDLRTAIAALRRSDSLLALAQRVDPQWLRPLIDRGWVAHDRARLLSGAARIAAIEEGLGHAEEAVRRAPESAAALELRGALRWQLVTERQVAPEAPEWERRAEADLRAALDRDSSLATAWATLGHLLWLKGSFAEAGIASRRALREDAYLMGARDVFYQLFFSDLMLGNFVQAAEWCQRGRLSTPKDWRFLECELTLMRHDLEARPDPGRAWAIVRELEVLDPPDKARATGRSYHTVYRRVVAATISARAGRRDIARVELARARRATAGDSVLRLDLAYDEAYLRLVLGEPRNAATLLQELMEARPVLRSLLARDPLFRDLRLKE